MYGIEPPLHCYSVHKKMKTPPVFIKTEPKEMRDMLYDGVQCHYLPYIINSAIFHEDSSDYKRLVIESSDDEGSSDDINEMPNEDDVESPVTAEMSFIENKEYVTPVRSYRKPRDPSPVRSCRKPRDSSPVRSCRKPRDSSPVRSYRKPRDSSVSDKKPKPKPEYSADSSSDSCSSSCSSHHSKKKTVESEYLYGFYPCEACNVTLNNLQTYRNHLSGKKHQKAVKEKDEAEGTVRPFCFNVEEHSRYPQAPAGVYRKTIPDTSYIQETVEKKLLTPCPGLEHVIEIRALKETSYYCGLCDAPCSVNCIISHLKGYKHMLQCLRLFKPTMYDKILNEPKYKVEREIKSILRYIQKREGMGKILVEEEYLESEFPEPERARRRNKPSTNYEDKDVSFTDYYTSTIIPDTSKSDFYCKVCDAHMNSVEMWEAHVRGKRHLTNIKKNPGARPSKVKSVKISSKLSFLMAEVKKIEEPVVGLNHIKEVQNLETKKEMYNCFLCGGCLTSVNIVEHVLSQKHRVKYLTEIKFAGMETVKHMNLSENSLFYIVEDMAREVERKYGTGRPEVYMLRNTGA